MAASATHRTVVAFAVVVSVGLFAAEPVRADDRNATPGAWYVIGGYDDNAKSYREYLNFGLRASGADFGVVFSQVTGNGVMPFTSGATSPRADRVDGQALMVSGTYDFETGTIVTPRIVGGLGVSYLGLGAGGAMATADPTIAEPMAPTAHIGFGADFDLGDTWAVSASYQAMYVGENDREGRLGESRLDKKFVVGAKVRF